MKRIDYKLFISVILLALIILISLIISVTLDFGGRRKESLTKAYYVAYTSSTALPLHDFANAQEWLRINFPKHMNFYLNQSGGAWFEYTASGDLSIIESCLGYFVEPNPRTIFYNISPFIKVYEMVTINELGSESGSGCIRRKVYYSTNKGEYIYIYSPVEAKQYLFPIDEAYKLSEFLYENSEHSDKIKVEEYEHAAKFEIKPIPKAICFIGQVSQYVILWGMLFIIVKFILKRREKALDKSPASTIDE